VVVPPYFDKMWVIALIILGIELMGFGCLEEVSKDVILKCLLCIILVMKSTHGWTIF
jgi:hypothetical protein